ncbi:putative ribonuclease t2 [Erysiphe necator]|uniref:ribonuclease T2 n=1 Tax=Uncinula necator TaxID=52586 RepID=A0A0B1PF16_UNCNE|nr:putative ribonuclease t2 [Erysiphe necator]
MSTQFWDTHPAVGPANSWTIHGLWPDNCDGSYPTYCSAAPQYHNLSEIISKASPSLFEYMKIYWLPNRGSPDSFWMHEWNKHGTCVNTLAPSCYSEDQYIPGIEVVEYFQKAVDLFQQLDTYKALSSAGILPRHDKTYSLKEIQETLTKVTGQKAIISCQGTQLNQVWYSFNVKGSLQAGRFVPTYGIHESSGNCPAEGIIYSPKDM